MQQLVKFFSEIAINSKPARPRVPVLQIPVYELHGRATELAPDTSCMLYWGRGVMSRLHASQLLAAAGLDKRVFAPESGHRGARG